MIEEIIEQVRQREFTTLDGAIREVIRLYEARPGVGEDAEREAGLVEAASLAFDAMFEASGAVEARKLQRAILALSRTRQPTEPKPAQGTGESK